jgi:hypothetical protein
MAQDTKTPAADDKLAEAMKIVQAHVDQVAQITGQPHMISFVGGKSAGCDECPLASLGKGGPLGATIVSSRDLPPGLADALGGLFARLRRSDSGRGSGGH